MGTTNKRFYDVLTRHQIYLEGVKLGQAQSFSKIAGQINDELRKLLSSLKFATLDGMTKAQLADLLAKVRMVQTRVYSNYAQDLELTLRKFMRVDLTISKYVFKRVQMEYDATVNDDPANVQAVLPAVRFPQVNEDLGRQDGIPLFGVVVLSGETAALMRLWSLIVNTPLPANGVLPLSLLAGSMTAAKAAIEQTIVKAYANRATVAATLQEISGTASKRNLDGVLARVFNQQAAVTDTLIQHISSVIQAAAMSYYFKQYVWSSVIDGVTTEICRNRNGKVYRFGEGPIPPAHIRCRSKITPLVGKDDAPDSYFAWLKAQPADIQTDILGANKADALRAGKLRAKDLPKFDEAKPITIDAFAAKIKTILQP